MFWRKNKEEKAIKLELPPLEELERWVHTLIIALELEEGSFTILPAFGGILLFIKDEGISWIPYREIQEALGKVDKIELADTSTILGAAAVTVAAGSGGVLLPIILVRGLLKGSYRTITNPPPSISRTFLKSMIREVIIEERKISSKLLKTFEEDPYLVNSKTEVELQTHKIYINKKFLDYAGKKTRAVRVAYGIKSFFIRSIEAVFSIPPQSDVKKFGEILESHDISVLWKPIAEKLETSKDNAIKIEE